MGAPSKQGDETVLSNGVLRLTFDRASGALAQIENPAAGRSLAIAAASPAPVRIWIGSRSEPDQGEIVIARSTPRACAWKRQESGGEVSLAVWYEDLVDRGHGTGIALTQTYTLAPGEDFVRLRTSIENRGSWWITGLFLGLESLVMNEDGTREQLAPGLVWSEPVRDPRHNLPAGSGFVPYPAGSRAFSVPPTVPNSLLMSWIDYADDRGGLGVAYLDRSDMDISGDVRAEAGGLAVGWRLFRLEGTRGFMWGYNGKRQNYPLAPGEQFSTDEWLLVLHGGDWHPTAAAYRKRYEVAFRGDFLDWEHTSPAIRSCDLVFNNNIAWGDSSKDPSRAYDYPNGHVIKRFEEIAPLTRQAIDALGAKPENVIVNTLGTGPDWGIYKMPDHFPMVEAAGGQAAAERMAADLNELGVAGICCYAHPYFLHRKANNYVASADTGRNYPHQDWHTSMGGIACMSEPAWQKLWSEKIYPRYAAMGIRGLYFDEGFGHQFICTNPEHSHGGSSVAILTAQSRGATELYRHFRDVIGPRAFLSCEGGSDLQARWIDLWHFEPTELLRFTHPDKLMMVSPNPKRIAESVAGALLFGCPLIFTPSPADTLQGEMLDVLRRFVALRREMREARVPGYPQGFRDTAGLSVRGGSLRAKVYTGPKGATVVYFAAQPFDGELVFEGARRKVTAAANQMGYAVFTKGGRHAS